MGKQIIEEKQVKTISYERANFVKKCNNGNSKGNGEKGSD